MKATRLLLILLATLLGETLSIEPTFAERTTENTGKARRPITKTANTAAQADNAFSSNFRASVRADFARGAARMHQMRADTIESQIRREAARKHTFISEAEVKRQVDIQMADDPFIKGVQETYRPVLNPETNAAARARDINTRIVESRARVIENLERSKAEMRTRNTDVFSKDFGKSPPVDEALIKAKVDEKMAPMKKDPLFKEAFENANLRGGAKTHGILPKSPKTPALSIADNAAQETIEMVVHKPSVPVAASKNVHVAKTLVRPSSSSKISFAAIAASIAFRATRKGPQGFEESPLK